MTESTPIVTSAPSPAADAAASPGSAVSSAPACCAAPPAAAGALVRRFIGLLGVIAVVLIVDQATKVWAIHQLRPTQFDPLVYLGGLLRLQYAENSGAFLSLMADWPTEVRFWVLTVINGVVLTGVFALLTFSRSLDRWVWFALVLILAGGIGNLIDRIRFHGLVIDFLNIGIGRVRTGIFNVADIAITAGFLMMIPRVIFPEKLPEEAAAGQPLRENSP